MQTTIQQRIAQAAPHPRLLWPAGGPAAVRAKLSANPLWQAAADAVRLTAEHMLNEPTVVYKLEGRRLLEQSRTALSRITHLSFAACLTGDQRYRVRAVAEMQAAAAMPDWNPSHFLDTAEMTLALAIGYDWLYAELTPVDRTKIRTAIEEKGLGPYLKPGAQHWWEQGSNNWNQVCHASMVSGALALLKENPNRAAEVVARALAGLPKAMKVYDPDGAYPEGPGYWNYGTTFNVLLIAMLESALGSDFGLSNSPGFLKTGDFLLHTTGPTGQPFSFSDCGTTADFSAAMVWFASRTHRPELLWFEAGLLERKVAVIRDSHGARQGDRFLPLAILWADAQLQRAEPVARNWFGVGPNPLAVYRSSWTDPNALFLAIKAGSPSISHGHMDIGSFILEADGVRWSLDLGTQDYHASESRGLNLWSHAPGSDRWRIFRHHNRAHSTLLVDDQEQVASSHAPITEFSAPSGGLVAVVDLSATYAGQLAAAKRRFTVEAGHRVIVEDQLTGGTKPTTVRWGMVTPGRLTPDGWLERDGHRLRIEVLAPSGVKLCVWPADPPPHDFDEPNPGVSIVGFTAPLAAGQAVTWRVILTPDIQLTSNVAKRTA